MSEGEETKWRLGVQSEGAEERAAELSAEEDEKKEQLQQKIQTKAEELGGGGEGSIVTKPEEAPIVETLPKGKQAAKTKRPALTREMGSNIDMTKILQQLERQADQVSRIEKVILPLQRLVNKIDKQANTIKQLYMQISQIQRRLRSIKSQGKKPASRSKKRGSIKGRQS
jgi:hypothetical protein